MRLLKGILLIGIFLIVSSITYAACNSGIYTNISFSCWDGESDTTTLAVDQWKQQFSINLTFDNTLVRNSTNTTLHHHNNMSDDGGSYSYCFLGQYAMKSGDVSPVGAGHGLRQTGSIAAWFIETHADYTNPQYLWEFGNDRPYTNFGDTDNEFFSSWYDGAGGYPNGATTNALISTKVWKFIVVTWDADTALVKMYVNGTEGYSQGTFGGFEEPAEGWQFGSTTEDGSYLKGCLDDIMVFNRTISPQEVVNLYNYGTIDGSIIINSGNLNVNVTTPKEGEVLNYSTNIKVNVSTEKTANCTINDTRFIKDQTLAFTNFTNFTLVGSLSDGDYSINLSCYNMSNLAWNGSLTRNFVVDTEKPSFSLGANNFFVADNSSVVGKQLYIINTTFTDNHGLFAFEVNVTDSSLTQVFGNTTIGNIGTSKLFNTTIDLSSQATGTYNATISVWDGHTLNAISDYTTKTGTDYIQYDNKIKITADSAISAYTTKQTDRYNFQFSYPKIGTPSTKTFYVESDGVLFYIEKSDYPAHFVDFKNKKWIDFSGISGKPTVTKVSPTKYQIDFVNSDTIIVFNSIGGLNYYHRDYSFYIDGDKPLTTIVEPASNLIPSNHNFTVYMNATDDYRNYTQFNLYNSTVLISSVNSTLQGSGMQQYNHSFGSLTQSIYYINATHFDKNGNFNSTATITIYTPSIDDCTTFTTITLNFTLKDETNGTVLNGNIEGDFNYTLDGTTYSIYSIDETGVNSSDICIYPPSTSFTVGYTIRYDDTNYPQRRYTVSSGTISNVTSNVNLYLLKSDVGGYTYFLVEDDSGSVLSGVKIRISLSGSVIEQKETDSSGKASFWVNPDEDYVFELSKSGYVTQTLTMQPIISNQGLPYEIQLSSSASTETIPTSSGIAYFFNPTGTITNGTTHNFAFNLTSSYWGITSCSLNITNGTSLLGSSTTSYGTGYCNITLAINTLNYTRIVSTAYWQLNNSYNMSASIEYMPLGTYQGQFSLMTFFQDISSFADAGFNNFTRWIIALIVIIIITVVIANMTQTFEASTMLITICILTYLFCYLNWMRIEYSNFPLLFAPVLQQYAAFIVVLLASISFLMIQYTRE